MKIQCDVIIIGGGVAGLLILNQLRLSGYSVLLLEKNALAQGQTIASQGIIHGGAKYALKGKLSEAAKTVSKMTQTWANYFSGQGSINLSEVKHLSEHHYLWSSGWGASFKNLLTSQVLSSENRVLHKKDLPEIFQHSEFRGSLCELDECVLDVPSLVSELARPHRDYCLKIDESWIFDFQGEKLLGIRAGEREFQAKKYVFTAGEGNEEFAARVGIGMQRRPLKMTWLKWDRSLPVFVHYVGGGIVPQFTITTHPHPAGSVWVVGGGLAETGVQRSDQAQIQHVRQELMSKFSWIDFSKAEFGVFSINRAEQENGGKRPDTFFLQERGNCFYAWPTKLTLAPALAEALKVACSFSPSSLEGIEFLKQCNTVGQALAPWEC